MEQKIEILDFEDKKMKDNGDFTRFRTSDGMMSAFDAEIIKTLKNSSGTITVDISTSGDGKWKTIREIISDKTSDNGNKPQEIIRVTVDDSKIQNERNKTAGVAYRFATDLVNNGRIDMDELNATAKGIHTGMKELAEKQ